MSELTLNMSELALNMSELAHLEMQLKLVPEGLKY